MVQVESFDNTLFLTRLREKNWSNDPEKINLNLLTSIKRVSNQNITSAKVLIVIRQ